MNITDFTYLINNPKEINKEYTKQLEDVITAFPYFQPARALYLKGLKNQDNFKYNQTLKNTAAYTTDRSILFEFITSPFFTDEVINTEEIDVESIEVIHQKIAETTFTSEEKKSIESLEIGKPIEFKNDESHSFNEWLQLGSFKPIKRGEKTEVIVENQEEKVDLIDKFIAKKPKIKSVKNEVYNPIALKHEPIDYNTLMTETLAKVYLEQKKYKNAIKAYRILSLKYPEKSSIFAHRIKAIKLLDKN
ncbi:MAG: hypothetical protein L3J14_00185 [Flavobacteriaceae bacterium]|nr:hypothetical protein [Flavobacteriaceae bacterium]